MEVKPYYINCPYCGLGSKLTEPEDSTPILRKYQFNSKYLRRVFCEKCEKYFYLELDDVDLKKTNVSETSSG